VPVKSGRTGRFRLPNKIRNRCALKMSREIKTEKLTHSGTASVQHYQDSVLLEAVALILLVFIAYWNSLAGSFHFDDFAIFLDPYIMASGFGWEILRLVQTRPLTFLTFHWNYIVGGAGALGFHLINVLIHAANSVLVLLVARRQVRPSLAWIAGALFALHPLQTQAVNYVFERATLLAAFFAFLALLFFLQEKYWWAVLAFGLSLLAKEETIALPAFLLVYDLVRKRRVVAWQCCAVMGGLGVLAAARLFYALRVNHETHLGFGTKGIPAILYAFTQSRVVLTYLRMFFLPIGLTLDHEVTISRSLWAPPETLIAVLALTMLVGTLVWLALRGNEAALWALGFFVLLSPSSSIVPAIDFMFEHRVYFPAACLAIAAVLWLARLRSHLPLTALLAILLALSVVTLTRNRVWHDDASLWADVIEKSPGKARGYFALGQVYASSDHARALQLYEDGLAIEPNNSDGHINLGRLMMALGDLEGALQHLNKALLLEGNAPLIWNSIGVAELRFGQIQDGIRAFRHALETDPCRFDARLNLIHTLFLLNERESMLKAAEIPKNCRFLPEQAQKLESELQSLQ
jgi:protein O-mannosyl-transferase